MKEGAGEKETETESRASFFLPLLSTPTQTFPPHRCAQAGITRLFAYDPTGFLKESAPALRAQLARAVCVRVGWDGVPIPLPPSDPPSAASLTRRRPALADANARVLGGKPADVTGGHASPPPPPRPPQPPTVVVRLLSARDAEAPLLAAADALSRSATPSPAASPPGGGGGGGGTPPPPRVPPLTPATLDASLAATCGPATLAEPEIVLVYGRTFTLAGYPPWPLRHSEIYSMGPLTRASSVGVRSALARYGATSQRFGR